MKAADILRLSPAQIAATCTARTVTEKWKMHTQAYIRLLSRVWWRCLRGYLHPFQGETVKKEKAYGVRSRVQHRDRLYKIHTWFSPCKRWSGDSYSASVSGGKNTGSSPVSSNRDIPKTGDNTLPLALVFVVSGAVLVSMTGYVLSVRGKREKRQDFNF